MRRLLGLALTAHALDVRSLKPQRIMRKALGGAAASLACASLVLSPAPARAAKASNAASKPGSRASSRVGIEGLPEALDPFAHFLGTGLPGGAIDCQA